MGGWVVLQEPEEEKKVQQKDPHYPKEKLRSLQPPDPLSAFTEIQLHALERIPLV